MVNGDVSRDLATDDNIIDPVEGRQTLAERSERLHDQLKVKPSCLYVKITNSTTEWIYCSAFHKVRCGLY
jgi:hypothetical protein